ncbi:hypothetical protein [Pararhodobacter oceanensis]|uniref:hypothetical protein n=1 Tax=Pararhodobacter oceanensis TaxID=2172121 RepID=UPI003A95762A
MARRTLQRAINWGLPLLTLATYLYLAAYIGPQVMAQAEGQLPFDLRALGYSLGEARGYLRVLTPEGYLLAQGPMFWADTLFPLLLGATLLWWMRPFAGMFGMVCVLSSMSYIALDWGENSAVQAMLTAGPDWVRPVEVVRASTFTMAKFAALLLCAMLAVRQSLRRRPEGQTNK